LHSLSNCCCCSRHRLHLLLLLLSAPFASLVCVLLFKT
jgi:hypothetical protein